MTVAPASPPAPGPVIDACWARIGTRGDGSCPKLTEYIRCRNCPVFAAAARALLDRPLPADYAAEWSTRLATAKAGQHGKSLSAMIFRLAAEWFAVPTELLEEIAEMRPIHSLPHRRNPVVLGLCNVRGELIVCISLHAMLGLAELAPGDVDQAAMIRPRLVVIRHASGPIAFRVDEVQPTLRFDEAELRSLPATVGKAGSSSFLKGLLPWRDRMAGYLDAERTVQAINQSLA
jgi:chemotaxis-related protein WspD